MDGYSLEGTFIGHFTAGRLGAMYYNFRNLVLNILLTKFFDFFITIGEERLEYRLQPALLGIPAMPAEAGTLNALP